MTDIYIQRHLKDLKVKIDNDIDNAPPRNKPQPTKNKPQINLLLAGSGSGKTLFFENESKKDNCHYVDLYAHAHKLDSTIRCADTSKIIVYLDSIDELTNIESVLQFIDEMPSNITLWIASRPSSFNIQKLKDKTNNYSFTEYTLDPFSEDDITLFAQKSGVDKKDFLEKISALDMLETCKTPMTCSATIQKFKSGELNQRISKIQLHKEAIEALLNGSRKKTDDREFNENQLFRCASWIALHLKLSRKMFVWGRQEKTCAEQCMSQSKLSNDDFSPKLIECVLASGVFAPKEPGKIGFSHKLYGDLLCAQGFEYFIAPDNFDKILFSNNNFHPEFYDIAEWLALNNASLLEKIFKTKPELLIESNEAIQSFSATKAFNAYFNYFEKNYTRCHFTLLKDPEIQKDLPLYLNKAKSFDQKFFLIRYIQETETKVPASNLAKIATSDPNRSVRIAALGIMGKLGYLHEINEIWEQYDSQQDPDNQLLAQISWYLFPKYINSSTIVKHLQQYKQNDRSFDYDIYMHKLIDQKLESLSEENLIPLLQWSVQYLNAGGHYGFLKSTAHNIYSFCWQKTNIPAIPKLLAKSLLNADIDFFMPKKSYSENSFFISISDFLKNKKARYKVLEILAQKHKPKQHISLYQYTDTRYNMLHVNDFDFLLKKMSRARNTQKQKFWSHCFTCIMLELTEKHKERIDQIRLKYSDIWSLEKINQHKRQQQAEQKQKQEQEQLKKKERLHYITSIVDEKNDFEEIWGNIYSEHSSPTGAFLKVVEWETLTQQQQHKLILLAHKYILSTTFQSKYRICILSHAFLLIYEKKRKLFTNISESLLLSHLPTLLDIGTLHEMKSGLTPIHKYCCENYRSQTDIILLEHFSKNPAHILYLKNLITTPLALGIISQDTAVLKNVYALQALKQIQQPEFVKIFQQKVQKQYTGIPERQDIFLELLEINPKVYFPLLVNKIKAQPKWGFNFITTTLWNCGFETKDLILEAWSKISPANIEFGKWLNKQKFGETEEARYADLIRNFFFEELSKNGKHEELALIYKATKLEYLRPLQQKAIEADLSKNYTPYTIGKIKELKDSVFHRLDTLDNLLESIYLCIKDFEHYLQDQETPACENLWNIDGITDNSKTKKQKKKSDNIVKVRWPKDEKHVSDELKRFLHTKLPEKRVSITRESEKRHDRNTPNQISGSRTDILIRVPEKKLEVVIEVKCNWNSDCKTAIPKQLVGQYLKETHSAGIFVLAWFESNDWTQHVKNPKWKTQETAKIYLQKQCEAEKQHKLKSIVVDCSA